MKVRLVSCLCGSCIMPSLSTCTRQATDKSRIQSNDTWRTIWNNISHAHRQDVVQYDDCSCTLSRTAFPCTMQGLKTQRNGQDLISGTSSYLFVKIVPLDWLFQVTACGLKWCIDLETCCQEFSFFKNVEGLCLCARYSTKYLLLSSLCNIYRTQEPFTSKTLWSVLNIDSVGMRIYP